MQGELCRSLGIGAEALEDGQAGDRVVLPFAKIGGDLSQSLELLQGCGPVPLAVKIIEWRWPRPRFQIERAKATPQAWPWPCCTPMNEAARSSPHPPPPLAMIPPVPCHYRWTSRYHPAVIGHLAKVVGKINIAIRQCLLEFFHAFVRDLGSGEVYQTGFCKKIAP